MKQDLATSVFAAVIGALVAYFVCNMFLPALEDVTFSTIGETEVFNLAEPDTEVFNFRSVNPTVEVYVGNCIDLGENGVCNDNVIMTDGGGNEQQSQEENKEEENQKENNEENEDNNGEENGGENENENQEQNGDNENGTTN